MSHFSTVWIENVRPGDFIELPNGDGSMYAATVNDLGNGFIEITSRDGRTGITGPHDLEVRIVRRG